MVNTPLRSHFRTYLALAAFLFNLPMLFSQSGAKWATGGNSASAGDFFGTTNNYSIYFRTNNVQRMQLTNTGTLQVNSLAGTGNGFVRLDASGNFSRTSFTSDTTKFLGADGNFHSIASGSGWGFSGNNLFSTNSGNVGIGTSSPAEKLHVVGDVRVTGTVHATGLDIVQLNADTIRGVAMVGVSGNLAMTSGGCSDINAATGNLQFQSKPGTPGNTIFNAGTNGNVGVGTSTPQYKFDVNGDARVSGKIYVHRIVPLPGDSEIIFGDSSIHLVNNRIYPSAIGTNRGMAIGNTNSSAPGLYSLAIGSKIYTSPTADYAMVIGTGVIGGNGSLGNSTPNSLMIGFNSNLPTMFIAPATGINTTGAVCIGDSYIPLGFKLAVNGKIIAEEVNVSYRGNWPDTVFSTGYYLMPLPELASFVHKEHHLPGVISATEMNKKQNFSVGEFETTLLKKQEETTLYLIQLQNENTILQSQIDELRKELDELKQK